jgi:hypothetical protein
MFGNGLLQVAALSRLHQDIRIQKRYPQALGQKDPGGTFTRPGHADQYQVLFFDH